MKFMLKAATAALLLAQTGAAFPAQGTDDEAAFNTFCAACHLETPQPAGSPNERAPSRPLLRQFTAEAVLNALTNGKMQPQGTALNDPQRRAVAEYVTGKRLDPKFVPAGPVTVVNRCSVEKPMGDAARLPGWNGFGNGVAGTRYQTAAAGGLTAADLPKLKLKWAFGYANVGSARAQPTLAGGRLFIASENGEVHALDPQTGCTYWSYKALAGVRTAPSVGPYRKAGGGKGQAVYFGDQRANAYALDAQTGRQLWTRKVDFHAAAGITGAPTVHGGRVFVPVQGLGEEGRGSSNNYPCCTFRGSVSALDASTGEVLWKTYTVDTPQPRGKSALGVQMWGPAGGGIWSAPAIDVKRGVLYVATGNAYADPPQKLSNAILALDQRTGAVKWAKQIIPADNWAMGCEAKNPGNPACPETLGPDYDFSATPALVHAGTRDLIVIPQKSAIAWALDPDRQGEIVWQQSFGKGSGLGGQWGAATDGTLFYVGLNDFLTDTPGGMHAFRVADGTPVWSQPPPSPLLCGAKKPGCGPGQGGAVTAIPGAVLAGSHDGGLRAYAAKDGTVIWQFDMNREFVTVNGVKANGASMDGPGAIVAGGMLFVNSGYGGLVGRPGNVLLAFGRR
jgi:polyvinyl alcohol dehydrogenase (cytochrome)